jgi:phosphotriesterase-related protein
MNDGIFGPLDPHLQANWPEQFNGGEERRRRQEDQAVRNLEVAKANGVDTIMDRCVPGIGRDVPRLKRVAERAPVNILVCTGFYTWHELPFAIKFREFWGDKLKVPSLEELFVQDVEEGILDTGVRAAFIKIVSDQYGLVPDVMTALKAAAAAHRRTGAPLTTHTAVGMGASSGLAQQDELEKLDIDLSRVVIGHVDFTPADVGLEHFERLLDRGSLIGFDVAANYDAMDPAMWDSTTARVSELVKRGYTDRILLSGDSAPFSDMTPDFATDEVPVYTVIQRRLLPMLRERGVAEPDIEQMMVTNARRILETRDLGSY